MNTDADFNLIDEPWIIVLDNTARAQQVSILELFERADQFAAIGGEVPTQVFAITRLLLAFLHRALDGPADQEQWLQLWEAEKLPMERIRLYANQVRNRFGLFDPVAPFYQVADLHTANNTLSGLEKIVADLPNGEPFFTTRSAASVACLGPAEAARWLVHVHAFDPSGIKSGAVGDPTVKNNRGYPIGTGWSGQIGGILVEGNNLRETLVLNLISRDVGTYVRIGVADDIPPWERDPDGPAWQQRPPRGTVDLYTWQTRRVRLAGDRDGVIGVVLANGDKIEPQNRHGLEPHSAWRYNEPQTKKHKTLVYMPLAHDPNRSMWRGLDALLPATSGRRHASGSQPRPFLAPGVLQWISDLAGQGHLPDNYTPGIRVVGAKYGTQNATFSEIIDDQLPLSVRVLREDQPDAVRAAVGAVEDSDAVAFDVWRLAENVAQAAGAEPKSGAGDAARELLYGALEEPYRRWVSALVPGVDVDAARVQWRKDLYQHARSVAGEIVAAAPPSAWTGRQVRNRLVNVAIAEVWFSAALRKLLPPEEQQPETTPEEVML